MEEQIVRHMYEPVKPEVRVKLTKNTKAYGWEVSVSGTDGEEVLSRLKVVDSKLRDQYGDEPKKED